MLLSSLLPTTQASATINRRSSSSEPATASDQHARVKGGGTLKPRPTMSRPERGPEASTSIASEPFAASSLALDRRNSKIRHLQSLRQRYNQMAGPSTIDYELKQIRDIIQSKALDEDFSVAIRERWQTWSRNANPFRTNLASSAASEMRSAEESASESDDPSDVPEAEELEEPAADESSHKKKRKRTVRASGSRKRAGIPEMDVTQTWESIRREREAFLKGMDAALPGAFRFTERQLKVYAHRLKSKYINSLDRPFEAKDIHRLLRQAEAPRALTNTSAADAKPSQSAAVSIKHTPPQPCVFTISFFSSSIDGTTEDAAAQQDADSSTPMESLDGDNTRDDYVKRICGDGLGGMKRAQTVELLSTQTLSDLQSSLCCWSDEQPERLGWQERLQRHVQQRSHTNASKGAREATAMQPGRGSVSDMSKSEDACLSRFTGRRRQTDVALIIEHKLYAKGVRHGDTAHEADYATLFDAWKQSTGNTDAQAGWTEQGGNLDLCLDQLSSVRVGQPYWLLHQGDCVHCFVVEQVRALRPSEQNMLRHGASGVSIENASVGTSIPFPRVTWLSTPTMLRFAADHNHNYGLGHHILRWEGMLPLPDRLQSGQDKASSGSGSRQKEVATPWQIANLRTRRKDEGMLRKRQGKCLACLLRKAQVGILGGEAVRLPLGSAQSDVHADDVDKQDEPAINGLDDHLTTICTPCAAILGLPTRPPTTENGADGRVELDWEQIAAKDHHAGWTVFPLY